MSFEFTDYPAETPPAFEELTATAADEADAFIATGIEPIDDLEGYHINDRGGPMGDAPAPPAELTFREWYDFAYYVGDIAVSGTEDRYVEAAFEQKTLQLERAYNDRPAFLRSLEYTHRYDDMLVPFLARLAKDFGPDNVYRDFHVITAEAYDEYNRLLREIGARSRGFYYMRDIVLIEDLDLHARCGDELSHDFTRLVALHEGAHSARRKETCILSVAPPKPGERTEEYYRALPDRITVTITGGLTEYDAMKRARDQSSLLWEEAFAQSYALRTADEMGVDRTQPIDSGVWKPPGTPYRTIVTAADRPPFDPATQTIYIPWHYTNGAYLVEGKAPWPVMNDTAIPAYALDLLDNEIPGLFEEMKRAHVDADRLPEIHAAVEDFAPGLYKYAVKKPGSAEASHRHLLRVVRAIEMARTGRR